MFNFTDANFEKIIIHQVGNKQLEENLHLADNEINVSPDVKDILETYLLSSFNEGAFYHFTHETDIKLNDVFSYVSELFENPDLFIGHSVKIATHLFEQSTHSKIKGGEFYTVLIRDCIVDDELVDAIGLFKSENKDTFIKIVPQNGSFGVQSESGINIKKLDKGCLVFNTEKEMGYKVVILDNLSKNIEAKYWKTDFLGLKERNDDFYQTHNYLQVCKDFVKEVYNEHNNVEKTDQIDMLNRSISYFNENDNFTENSFKEEVMKGETEVVEAFEDYKKNYQENNQVDLGEDFEINEQAVKKAKRQFKSVLKLDKNFHIYIHGDREKITKGFDDEKGMNYYMVYYEEET